MALGLPELSIPHTNILGLIGSGVSKLGTGIDAVLPGSPAAALGGAISGTRGGLSEAIANPNQRFYNSGPSTAQTVNPGADGIPAPTATASDPYAAYGGQTNYNNLLAGFNSQAQNVRDTANQAAGSTYNSLLNGPNGILDLIQSLTQNQNKINLDAQNNELNKINAVTGVNNLVGKGLHNAGTLLSSRNAGNSSAAAEFARQYAELGRQQLSGVGNQYQQGQNTINQEQADQGLQQGAALRHLQATKESAVNGIVQSASDQLNAINNAMINASLPDRIQMGQEQARIKAAAMAQLGQLDTQLNQGLGGISATTKEQNVAQAQQNAVAGVAPANAFQFSTQLPGPLQGTGPTPASLPLFQFPTSNKKQLA